MKKQTIRNRIRGITLIALVITIIVLLILAGISISMLEGNNSILIKTTQSREQTEIADEKETIKIAVMQAMTDNKSGDIRPSNLQNYIDNNRATVFDDEESFYVLFKTNRMYKVDGKGKIDERITTYQKATKKLTEEIKNTEYGTQEKPYEINSIEDLVDLSYKVNGIVVDKDGALTYTNTRNSFTNKYIILTKDLNFKLPLSYEDSTRKDYGDINGNGMVEELLTELTTGTGWIPIGGNGQNDSGILNGYFNGNNNSIINLYINNSSEKSYVALIGKTNSAIIEDINIKCDIYCNSTYAAGVVGYGNKQIENCSFEGKIENTKENIRSTTAGIVAYSNVDSIIEKCKCKGKIKGRFNVGGILGSGNAKIFNCYNESVLFAESNDSYSAIGGIAANGGHCEITDCYNTGKVEGPRNVGGITGGGVGKAERCRNSGHIISETGAGGINGGKTNGYNMKFIKCYNTGTIEGKNDVAGICGYNWVIGVSIFEECYNLGEIKGNSNVAGITGLIQVEGSKLCNCFNHGKITGTKISGVAWGKNDKVKMISCYNSGELYGTTKYGISSNGNIKNCYYLIGQTTLTENATGVSSEQLKSLATTLDKTYTIDEENNTITINDNTSQNVWEQDTNNINQGYPILEFQTTN